MASKRSTMEAMIFAQREIVDNMAGHSKHVRKHKKEAIKLAKMTLALNDHLRL